MIDLAAVLGPYLAQMGIGVASSAIYDAIRGCFSQMPTASRDGLQLALENAITANGLNVRAATIIDILANAGVIVIRDSTIYAPQKITFGARDGGQAFFGGTGESATDRTSIRSVGAGSGMLASGNAAVVQDEDGSIKFFAGPSGSMSFHAGREGNMTFSTGKKPKTE